MISFGIIGTNWITERLLNAAAACPDFRLTGVYSRTEEQGRAFADKYGAEKAFAELAAMAEWDGIDAVYIASPNALHAEQAILCMNHGKHVLCEKPIASNAAEFARMTEAARKNGVLLMEALKSSFLPGMAAIRDNLARIGTVRRYNGGYSQYSSRYDAYKKGVVANAFKPELSNGALMDLGVYGLYPMVALFGVPDTIAANAVMLGSGVDGQGTVLAGYETMEAVVSYSKINDSALPCEIQGELGSLIIDKISEPGNVTIRYRDGRTEELCGGLEEPSMTYELKHFIELIHSGKTESDINTHALSLEVLKICDEARKQIGLVYPADETMAKTGL